MNTGTQRKRIDVENEVRRAVDVLTHKTWMSLKFIALHNGINYKTLHSAFARRGISVRDIKDNQRYDGDFKVIKQEN